MKPGDHVRHEHKDRVAFGIVRALVPGASGEPRARVKWIIGRGDPFPVCVENLTPDSAGVIRGILGALGNM